jgi:hypothetical protein
MILQDLAAPTLGLVRSSGMPDTDPPITPDGRYLVVRGRLWRAANPHLTADQRTELVHELMRARRDVGTAMRAGDEAAERKARVRVDATKHALGERGPVWWSDGAPDLNRHMAANTVYSDWYLALNAGMS